MKKILKCKVTLFVLVCWIALSAVGYVEENRLYGMYEGDIWHTPYFVQVLQGMHDGIYPWSEKPSIFGGDWNQNTIEPEVIGTELETEATSLEPTEAVVLPKEFVQVEEDYFDDAVFIGDSRTVGLHDYGGLDKSTFYATVGMNIFDMWQEAFCEVDGEKLTLEEALTRKQFKKIYFQIGINEMGRGTVDGFMQAYTQSVAKFQQLQPDAIIYVQGIMRVTKEKSEEDPIFNNVGINERNQRIAALADQQSIFYIDVNEVVCDKEGNLKSDLTFDNLHLYGSKYDIWVDFLKTKGIIAND